MNWIHLPYSTIETFSEHFRNENTVCSLAGVYGDVQRVKIMYNKKDTALVQFADALQAQLGAHLHMLDVFVVLYCAQIVASVVYALKSGVCRKVLYSTSTVYLPWMIIEPQLSVEHKRTIRRLCSVCSAFDSAALPERREALGTSAESGALEAQPRSAAARDRAGIVLRRVSAAL